MSEEIAAVVARTVRQLKVALGADAADAVLARCLPPGTEPVSIPALLGFARRLHEEGGFAATLGCALEEYARHRLGSMSS